MPGVQSPTVRRRRLGQELRRLREAARLTIEDVAQRLEVSPAKISRIETGRVGVRPRDVSDLLDQYEIHGTHRDNLLALTREARQQGWWHSYSDVLSDGTDTFLGLETEAESIRLFEVQVINGLLQTSEYARAVLRAYYRSEPPEQIERRVNSGWPASNWSSSKTTLGYGQCWMKPFYAGASDPPNSCSRNIGVSLICLKKTT